MTIPEILQRAKGHRTDAEGTVWLEPPLQLFHAPSGKPVTVAAIQAIVHGLGSNILVTKMGNEETNSWFDPMYLQPVRQ